MRLPFLVLALSAFTIAAPPAGGATCDPFEQTHTYVGSWIPASLRLIKAPVWDTCDSILPGTYVLPGDGDLDMGLGGGAFPAYNPCLNLLPPYSNGLTFPMHAHHGAYEGAVYWAVESPETLAFVGNLEVFVGTDGAVDTSQPCVGDGIASSDAEDCTTGATSSGLGWGTAALEPNSASANCGAPADGFVWVTVVGGIQGRIEQVA